jgi:AcrR family transcriptional regulator
MAKVPAKRVRRSPEAARLAVLDVAERRLREHGLDGLAIVDVAAEVGMSHATLLHHFGTSDEMRNALIERMATNLLNEVSALLASEDDEEQHSGDFFVHLFEALAGGGHAKLIGWQNLVANSDGKARMSSQTRMLFDQVLDGLRIRLIEAGRDAATADRDARFIVLLVVSSALGFGIGRGTLLDDVGLTEQSEIDFALWMGQLVSGLMR